MSRSEDVVGKIQRVEAELMLLGEHESKSLECLTNFSPMNVDEAAAS